jgi:hypothetical protein
MTYMADQLRQYIPTQEQMEALAASIQRFGHAARDAADNMVNAFATAARQMELLRWDQAESLREVTWWFLQQKAILRQQLDRDSTTFGCKRRRRRARGRLLAAKMRRRAGGMA